jgi:hypothetical protein
MQSLTRFWRSLERLSGGGTVAEEWKLLTGDEYQSVRRFLRSSTSSTGGHWSSLSPRHSASWQKIIGNAEKSPRGGSAS